MPIGIGVELRERLERDGCGMRCRSGDGTLWMEGRLLLMEAIKQDAPRREAERT